MFRPYSEKTNWQHTKIALGAIILFAFVIGGWLWGVAAVLALLGGIRLVDFMNWRD